MKWLGRIILGLTLLLLISIILKALMLVFSVYLITFISAILVLLFFAQTVTAVFTQKNKLLMFTGVTTSFSMVLAGIGVLFAYMFWPMAFSMAIPAIFFGLVASILLVVCLSKASQFTENEQKTLNTNFFFPAAILYTLLALYLIMPGNMFYNTFNLSRDKVSYEEWQERSRKAGSPEEEEKPEVDIMG